MDKDIINILQDLQPKMKEKRFVHTCGVMFTAGNLAGFYGEDMNKALLAGALHDCAKLQSITDYLKECDAYGVSYSDEEKLTPHILHAPLGAYFAKEKYGVKDEDILHAISVHTTGCEDMSMLDKIIYIADYIEPSRGDEDYLNEIRRLAYKDLDMAVYVAAEQVLYFLKDNGYAIDSKTVETRDYYKNIVGGYDEYRK